LHAHCCGDVTRALEESAGHRRVLVEIRHNNVDGAGRADGAIGSHVVGLENLGHCVGFLGVDVLNLVPLLHVALVGQRPVTLPERLVVSEHDVEVVSLEAEGRIAASSLELVAARPTVGHGGLVDRHISLVGCDVEATGVELHRLTGLVATAARIRRGTVDAKLAEEREWIRKVVSSSINEVLARGGASHVVLNSDEGAAVSRAARLVVGLSKVPRGFAEDVATTHAGAAVQIFVVGDARIDVPGQSH